MFRADSDSAQIATARNRRLRSAILHSPIHARPWPWVSALSSGALWRLSVGALLRLCWEALCWEALCWKCRGRSGPRARSRPPPVARPSPPP
eukprot:6436686-Alexandrium_andersonii.AAC.1